MKTSTRTLILAALLCGLAGTIATLAKPQPHPSGRNVVCSDCHTCKNPSASEPCLSPCPRPRVTKLDLDKGPETVSLNLLENEYEGVIFNHRLHAEMSAMGEQCANCHHFSEGGRIASCSECHPTTDVTAMHQPGLKAAYHRQCMKCHQDWSGVTSCEMCHAKKAVPGTRTVTAPPATEDLSKRFFPPMEEPEKKVWQSTYNNGTVVTFFHRNHTETYGIDCASCHHAEGCGSCHRKGTTTQKISHSEEALHSICNSCHAEMGCDQCHLKTEAQPFSHDRTGWPLGKYHSKASCHKCHGDTHHFTKPNRDCNGCHSHWNTTTFDHARTGFALNELHKDLDCENCHAQRNFAPKPTCGQCHEADFIFPAKLPGDYVKGKP
jgi:hypothetical protein